MPNLHIFSSKHLRYALLLGVLLTGLGLRLWHGSHKEVFHFNEGYSYLTATGKLNQFSQLFEAPTPLNVSGQELLNHYQIDVAQPRNYRAIAALSSQDVHPPLYYVFLHEMMRLNGGMPHIWLAIWPNLVFYLVSALLLYALGRTLFPGSGLTALLAVALFSLAAGPVTMSLFTRMYELLMTFTLATTLIWARWMMGKARPWELLALGLCLLGGLLTHYYFLIWSGLLLLAGLVWQRRQRQQMLTLIGVYAAAGIAFAALYPAVFAHLTGSKRAKEMQALGEQIGVWLIHLRQFVAVDIQTMVYLEGLLICGIIAAWALWRWWPQRAAQPLLTPQLLLGLAILVFATITGIFSPYRDIRYHAPILPLLALTVAAVPALLPKRGQFAVAGLLLLSYAAHAPQSLNGYWSNHIAQGFKRPEQLGVMWAADGHKSWRFWGALGELHPQQRYVLLNQRHFQGTRTTLPILKIMRFEQMLGLRNVLQGHESLVFEIADWDVLQPE